MAGWSFPQTEEDFGPRRTAVQNPQAREGYFLTAIPNSTEYVLQSPHGSKYRLSTPEAVRLQVAGVPFEAKGGQQ